jgi:hypothetical protein
MMDTLKKELSGLTFLICITIVVLSGIVSLGYYNVNDRKLMAQNIDSAISKGIDPISVRCSYAASTDTICVAFAASAASHNVSSQVANKK